MEHSRRRDAIASIIAVAMLILLPIIGFLAIGLEDVFTKWEIQNPHVNKRYKGWKEVSLFDNETIKIPKNWTFDDEDIDGIYELTDGNGKRWAVGTLFGTTTDRFNDYEDFVSSVLSVQPENITIEYREPIMGINTSAFHTITSQHSDKISTYYCMYLSGRNSEFLFILFSDIIQNASDFDIAEAIMYSFEYE